MVSVSITVCSLCRDYATANHAITQLVAACTTLEWRCENLRTTRLSRVASANGKWIWPRRTGTVPVRGGLVEKHLQGSTHLNVLQAEPLCDVTTPLSPKHPLGFEIFTYFFQSPSLWCFHSLSTHTSCDLCCSFQICQVLWKLNHFNSHHCCACIPNYAQCGSFLGCLAGSCQWVHKKKHANLLAIWCFCCYCGHLFWGNCKLDSAPQMQHKTQSILNMMCLLWSVSSLKHIETFWNRRVLENFASDGKNHHTLSHSCKSISMQGDSMWFFFPAFFFNASNVYFVFLFRSHTLTIHKRGKKTLFLHEMKNINPSLNLCCNAP